MLKNGDTKNIYIDTYHSDLEEKYIIGYDKTLLVNWCWAKDEKHAIKITNELRTRLIAEGKFK
jgi:hypothetical protein